MMECKRVLILSELCFLLNLYLNYIIKSYSKVIKLSFYLPLSLSAFSVLFVPLTCFPAILSSVSFITLSFSYSVSCFSVFFVNLCISLGFFLLILKICYTFAAVNRVAMTYPTTITQQRNFNFFAFFSALYLVVSDILLTHTHTHTHTGATNV